MEWFGSKTNTKGQAVYSAKLFPTASDLWLTIATQLREASFWQQEYFLARSLGLSAVEHPVLIWHLLI